MEKTLGASKQGSIGAAARGPRPISPSLGPMYSISTDSISMKTNCSDFEDGAEVNDRPVREICGNSKKKSGKRAQAQTKRSLAIEQEGGTLC